MGLANRLRPGNGDVRFAGVIRPASFRGAYRRLFGGPETRDAAPADPGPGRIKPRDGPPLEVAVDASPEALSAMLAHIEARWRELGDAAPHFSVITNPDFLPQNIAGNEARFFETGAHDVNVLRQTAARCGVTLDGAGRCFELGCGVGRVSVWLAKEFAEVVAADVSPAHLSLAAETLARFGVSNVRLVRLESLGLDTISEFDAFFSVIVLQHNPPPVAAVLLDAALRKLRPGGIAYFQVPTYGPAYRFGVAEYLSRMDKQVGMEMHVLPQPAVFEILRRNRCDLLECREDDAVGDHEGFVSNSFFARKSAP
jgi:SAM-dependent methyltransferase